MANAVTVASFVAVTGLLLVRMRESDPAFRRTLTPLFVALAAVLVSLAAYTIAREVTDARPPVASAAVAVTVLLVPVAILAGQIRGRMFAARRLGSLVADVAGTPVTGEDVQRLVGDALGDPTVTLARWDGGMYRDVRRQPGRRAGRPRAARAHPRRRAPTRSCSTTRRSTNRRDVVRGLAAAGLMLLDNARLVDELRASRARIAEATHDGQVRIERDLHDGVQPHLSALLVKLGIARDLAEEDGAARAARRARRRRGGRREGAAHARPRRLSAAPARARARPGAAGVRGDGAGARARRGAREPGGATGGDRGGLLHRPRGDPERDQARRPGA